MKNYGKGAVIPMDTNQKEQIQSQIAMFKGFAESYELLFAEIDTLKQENEKLEKSIFCLDGEKMQLEKKITKLNSENITLIHKQADFKAEIAELQSKIRSLESALIHEADKAINTPDFVSENKRLQNLIQNLTLENEMLKAQLKNSGK
ncbi:MAG: hypothetical protein IJ644_01745 [Oscillospiraceae bacterium]|nr:hypothetical protein [Oscillospiraceae bacterium]